MKDIRELDKEFNKFLKTLENKAIDAQQHATEFMDEEAKSRLEIPEEARNTQQFVDYSNSLKIKKAQKDGNEIVSSVYSDLLVGGDDPKWQNVPVGAFLEWGTGPLGEGSNNYPHGYPYTTKEPWDQHTWLQLLQTGSWGITARPHLYPAFLRTRRILMENIKEAIEEAWME